MKFSRLAHACVAALALASATAWAANPPSPSEFEGSLQQWINPPSAASSGDGVSRRMLSSLVRELFTDERFIGHTNAWLKERGMVSRAELIHEWTLEFGRLLAAGVDHWGDADIERMLRTRLLGSFATDLAVCIALNDPAITLERAQAVIRPSEADTVELLRLLKRHYLDALANKVPPARPDPRLVSRAAAEVMVELSPATRDVLLGDAEETMRLPVQRRCEATSEHFKAVMALQGETGRAMRREYFLSMVETLLPLRGAASSEVKRQSSGEFEPGEVGLPYPPLARRYELEGAMKVEITVGAEGLATRVRTLESKFNRDTVTLLDGTSVPASQIFEPFIAAHYLAGRFMRRYAEGKAVPYQATVEMSWKLEDAPGLPQVSK